MSRLRTLQEKVEAVLERSLKARGNDNYLAYRIYHQFYHVNPYEALVYQDEKKLPSVESIGRCRRKAQQERPELIADFEKEDVQMKAQIEFIEYAEEQRYENF